MTGFDLAFTSALIFGTIAAALCAIVLTLRSAARKLNDTGRQTARWAAAVVIGWAAFAISFGAVFGLDFWNCRRWWPRR